MPYCVNCGVKLAESETKCPLCGAARFYPDGAKTAVPRYPAEVDRIPSTAKKTVLFVICGALFAAAVLSLLTDVIYSGAADWSLVAIAGLLIPAAGLASALLGKGYAALATVAAIALTSSALMLTIDAVYAAGCAPLGIPVALLSAAAIICCVLFWMKGSGKLKFAALVFAVQTVYVILLEILVNRFIGISLRPTWSLIAAAPLALLALGLYVTSRIEKAKSELSRRFHT